MSIAAFKWEDGKLMLLMNRENWESHARMIKPATWNANGRILGAWTEGEDNDIGKWCGYSKNGRVSFIVGSDSNLARFENNMEYLPVDFLKSRLSPKDFAENEKKIITGDLGEDDEYESDDEDHEGYGLVFHAIVADITSKSMFYIGKESTESSRVKIIEVANGVHTLSAFQGLDSDEERESRLKSLFTEMMNDFGNNGVPPINEIPAKFMYAPDVFTELHMTDYPVDVGSDEENDGEQLYGTTSTIALVVKEDRSGVFYQRYLENGAWKDHKFDF